MRTRKNLKGRSFTPEQEAELLTLEKINCQARIVQLGVAALLNHPEFLSQVELSAAAEMLQECVKLTKNAATIRDGINAAAREAEDKKAEGKEAE